MSNITKNLQKISTLLKESCVRCHRDEREVTVLAVSKGQRAEKLTMAWAAGVQCFGENYLQEALTKIADLSEIEPQWHFIGTIQANKTKLIARHFSWVHTLDSLRVARRLSQYREGITRPLNLCIQVNIDSEAGKSGVDQTEALELANAVARLPNVRLRGLMVLPRPRNNFADQREPFRRTAQLLQKLKNSSGDLAYLDTLSMGMTNDMTAAIYEGATIVRIGTGIFGPRMPQEDVN
jgi:PLP dependent protein